MNWRPLARIKDFQKVYQTGVKQVGRLLVVYLLSAEDNAKAVVASRKVGGAVQRNRAKRLLRESLAKGLPGRPGWADTVLQSAVFQKSSPSIDTQIVTEPIGDIPDQGKEAGLWIVLVARRNILSASSREVREELDGLLERMTEDFSSETNDLD